jgi:hypothetical protein
MVKGPENLAYYMLDYDINVAHWILIYIVCLSNIYSNFIEDIRILIYINFIVSKE